MKTISLCWAAAGVALSLGACATFPPPTAQMAVSRAALEQAQNVGANQLAPTEFSSAQLKLTQAMAAEKEERYREAARLAELAEVDALVAQSKARAAKTQIAAQELEAGVQTLRQEATRKSTNQ